MNHLSFHGLQKTKQIAVLTKARDHVSGYTSAEIVDKKIKPESLRKINIKGRSISLIGIISAPQLWLLFDEPIGYRQEEHDRTCKTYTYETSLHALTALTKLVNTYKRSKKDSYLTPIKLRPRK